MCFVVQNTPAARLIPLITSNITSKSAIIRRYAVHRTTLSYPASSNIWIQITWKALINKPFKFYQHNWHWVVSKPKFPWLYFRPTIIVLKDKLMKIDMKNVKPLHALGICREVVEVAVCVRWLCHPLVNTKHSWHHTTQWHHSCNDAEYRQSPLEVTHR